MVFNPFGFWDWWKYKTIIDGDDPIGLVQQPLEHSMVTVDLVADFLILDDYDATLNDTVLIGISELG